MTIRDRHKYRPKLTAHAFQFTAGVQDGTWFYAHGRNTPTPLVSPSEIIAYMKYIKRKGR